MVPMMKLRTCDDPAQRSEMETDVRVIEETLKAQEDRVCQQRSVAKAKQKDRNELETVAPQLVERVQPDIYQPIHLWRTVMDAVQPPQISISVKSTVIQIG